MHNIYERLDVKAVYWSAQVLKAGIILLIRTKKFVFIPHVLNELGIGSELGPQSIYGLFEGTDFPNQYG